MSMWSEEFVRELEKTIKQLRSERNEARREVCKLLASDLSSPSTHERDPIVHAAIRGWDCFDKT